MRRRIITIVSILVACLAIIPVLIGDCYTFLCADDFGFESGVMALLPQYNGSVLRASLDATWRMVFESQGTHLANFLLHFVRAYSRWGLPGFHFIMLLFSIFYFYSLYYLTKNLIRNKDAVMPIFAALSLASTQMIGTLDNRELFFWYTGAFNYTLELSLSFLGLGLYIGLLNWDSEHPRTIKQYIGASLFLFLAGWGTLEVAAIGCGLALMTVVFNYKKIIDHKPLMIPFIAALLGAITNLISPGNFARADRELIAGHITFGDAIRDACTIVLDQTVYILKSPTFIVLLLIVFVISLICEISIFEKANYITMITALIESILIGFLTAFPVAYGQHIAGFKAMRTHSTYLISARLCIIFCIIVLAQVVRSRWGQAKAIITKVMLAVTIIFALVGSKTMLEEAKEGFSYCIVADMYRGNMQRVYNIRANILSALEMAEEGSDQVIVIKEPLDNRCMYSMGLQSESGDVVNIAAAHLFEVNAISVIYE
ncbi:DUF6056 family protein [Butyrivibrio sp. NC2007]|uniref:DUF6056 family protein n=1 Tax=Butyrivibrio sp. NC2007 TaxID=1280683 RepID=UPI0003B6910E|nr:DUF6056 family protein [Butyrivibrio sp. NC2007]